MEIKERVNNNYNVMKSTSKLPEDAGNHKGMYACVFLSSYIFTEWLKIEKNITNEQLLEFAQLEKSYIDIVNDLSHVYRLELTVDQYQYEMLKMFQENESLKAENKKLLASLNFSDL